MTSITESSIGKARRSFTALSRTLLGRPIRKWSARILKGRFFAITVQTRKPGMSSGCQRRFWPVYADGWPENECGFFESELCFFQPPMAEVWFFLSGFSPKMMLTRAMMGRKCGKTALCGFSVVFLKTIYHTEKPINTRLLAICGFCGFCDFYYF